MKVEFELIPYSELQLEDRFVEHRSAAVTMKPGIISIPVQLYLGGQKDNGNSVYRITLKEVAK